MELKPCPFCGGKPFVGTTTRGSSIVCTRCGARVEYIKLCGHYKNIAMAKKWTYKFVEEKWNNRIETKGKITMNNLINNTTINTEKNTQTNGERIRAMTNEELAWALMEFRVDALCKAEGGEAGLPDNQKAICEWLEQTV